MQIDLSPRKNLLTLFACFGLLLACGESTDEAPTGGSEPQRCEDNSDCAEGTCQSGSCRGETSGSETAGADTTNTSNGAADAASTPCTPCQADEGCGREADLCLDFIDGMACGRDCRDDMAPCPDGTACVAVRDDDPAHDGALQCRPVIDQCSDCYDEDGDGFGIGPGCEGSDCDEENQASHSGAEEVCDGEDNDCDNLEDEGFDLTTDLNNCGGCGQRCAPPNASTFECVDSVCVVLTCPTGYGDCDGDPVNGCEVRLTRFYFDGDRDGYGGDPSNYIEACAATEGYSDRLGDCEDGNGEQNPGLPELCDDIDNDCDDELNEEVATPPADNVSGVCAAARKACSPLGELVEPDYNALPDYEAVETRCDGLDNDCDGSADVDCGPCLVPLRFSTVQEAAEARCEVIRIQSNGPDDLRLTNPPENVTLQPEFGRLSRRSVTVLLDGNENQVVRVSNMDLRFLTVTNTSNMAAVMIDRIAVNDVESFAAPVILAGHNITVQQSTFSNNEASGGSNLGAAVILQFAPNFRIIGNDFIDNRVVTDAANPDSVAGALFVEDFTSTGLIAGNLFLRNTVEAVNGGGAIFFGENVGGITLSNNTFVTNSNGANIQASSIGCQSGLQDGEFINNIFWDAVGRHVEGCDLASVMYSSYANDVPSGTGNLSADPLFLNADNDDYSLQVGSPMIDSGDPSEAFNDQDGSRNDIGFTGGPFGRQ